MFEDLVKAPGRSIYKLRAPAESSESESEKLKDATDFTHDDWDDCLGFYP